MTPYEMLEDVKLCLHDRRVRFTKDGKFVAIIYCAKCGVELMDSETWAIGLFASGFHDR